MSITVLVKPGSPTISPRTPVATEGRPVNLTCSSQGGSPSPQIFWYREGASEPLASQTETRGRLTSSLLSILPGKEDDGSSYRCTVWNRAMGQRQRLETATRLHVKCENFRITLASIRPFIQSYKVTKLHSDLL